MSSTIITIMLGFFTVAGCADSCDTADKTVKSKTGTVVFKFIPGYTICFSEVLNGMVKRHKRFFNKLVGSKNDSFVYQIIPLFYQFVPNNGCLKCGGFTVPILLVYK